ncbi:MAG: acyl-CoA thioesterase [Candidatus Obscuribacterales bacterium]
MSDTTILEDKKQARHATIRVVLLPRDTNAFGTIFGGVILSHIDLAGAVEARRHTSNRVVTVAMKEVIFKEPVFVGEVVSFYAHVIKTGNTSITVKVEVESERRGKQVAVTQAELTFVSIGEDGKPAPLKS